MNIAEQARQRALMGYLARQVALAADEIMPEILDLIHGDSEEAIDQSIAAAKAKSAALIQRELYGQVALREDPANIREGYGASDAELAQRVASMSLSEWSRNRNSVLGIPSTADFLGGS